MRLDMGKSMIDVCNITLTHWDYMPEVVDGGVTPKYREHFVSHPFLQFIDPIQIEVLM